jgi:hypothetical protein
MKRWFSLKSDPGAVLWGILCCWCGVLLSCALIWAGTAIEYVVPLSLFGTPAMVTLLIWLLSRFQIGRRV